MSRDEFLMTQWTPYPQPMASYWVSKEWSFGKVAHNIAQNKGGALQLAGLSTPFEIGSQQQRDPVLGVSIPAEWLCTGDSVAYQHSSGAVFLLSPNLQAQKIPPTRAARPEAAKRWQRFLEVVRTYFVSEGFRYWHTPNLLVSPGIDAHIDFFTAQGVRTQQTYFLPTSPEFALKKALVDGETKVFEIKACFRDDDKSPTHNPEFFMLEWYRAYADKWALFEDFLNLVRYVSSEMDLPLPNEFLASQTSIADLFLSKINFQLQPQTAKQELQALIEKHRLHSDPDDDWDDLFFRLYIEFIEPSLGFAGPQAIYNFPFSQGSLARKTEEGWADRFEIYWQGLELANAYQEQNDTAKMSERFQSEIEKRTRAQKTPHPQDPDFLAKMQQGLPPCSGIALGLDRLWMVLNKITTIQNIL